MRGVNKICFTESLIFLRHSPGKKATKLEKKATKLEKSYKSRCHLKASYLIHVTLVPSTQKKYSNKREKRFKNAYHLFNRHSL